MNNTQLTQTDLDDKMDTTDAAAQDAVSRIYAALGSVLLATNDALQDDAVRRQLETDLLAIDENARALKLTVNALTQEMALLAAFAREIRGQRDDALYELKDAQDRLEETEHTVEARVYNTMIDTIQETFYCSRKTADKLLYALWDVHADVSSATADMLDSIADAIEEHE